TSSPDHPHYSSFPTRRSSDLGNVYMTQRKYEEASNSFRRSISLDPNSAEAQNNLGEAQGELKQYSPALEAFQKAIALDRTFVKADRKSTRLNSSHQIISYAVF